MSESLPFLNSTGLVPKILDKIIEAQTPERYTQDFQGTVLGYGSGSARPFIPLLKRIGFLKTDGTPTELYMKFRDDDYRGRAMAEALKIGYAPLFKVNEYADKLPKEKLKGAVIQVTGMSKNSKTAGTIVSTFEALKSYADFDVQLENIENDHVEDQEASILNEDARVPDVRATVNSRGMNLSYTINLNLPASKDPEVFHAIFKSLKENLLS